MIALEAIVGGIGRLFVALERAKKIVEEPYRIGLYFAARLSRYRRSLSFDPRRKASRWRHTVLGNSLSLSYHDPKRQSLAAARVL